MSSLIIHSSDSKDFTRLFSGDFNGQQVCNGRHSSLRVVNIHCNFHLNMEIQCIGSMRVSKIRTEKRCSSGYRELEF